MGAMTILPALDALQSCSCKLTDTPAKGRAGPSTSVESETLMQSLNCLILLLLSILMNIIQHMTISEAPRVKKTAFFHAGPINGASLKIASRVHFGWFSPRNGSLKSKIRLRFVVGPWNRHINPDTKCHIPNCLGQSRLFIHR